MTRFWWVRHGPTHAKTMVGWSDLPADLSDQTAIARLSDYLPKDAIIISSDLIRAATTADAVQANRLRQPHDKMLREMHFGDWELRSHAEIETETPDLIRAFWDRPGEVCPPGGESWNDLNRRIWSATDKLIADFAGHNIIVVAHFGAILSALQRAENLTPKQAFSHRLDNFSVTEMVHWSDGWQMGRINHIA
jgi:alpha-ribazole phosphatase